MKIEEAISLLKQYIDYNNPDVPDFYTMEEACEVAIKALEQQPCDDVVSRRAVYEIINDAYFLKLDDGAALQESIHQLPSVTPQPKMGQWVYDKERDSYKCSLCGFFCAEDNLGAIPTNYCAGCGAKMSEIPTGVEGSEE